MSNGKLPGIRKRQLSFVLITFLFFLSADKFLFISHTWGAGQKWCWNKLVDDPKATFSVPNNSRPEYLKYVGDPVFGTKIIRITGDPATAIISKKGEKIGVWGDVVKHHYSKDQPWNSDGTLLHLTRNVNGSPAHLFLDGETYEVLFTRAIPGHDNRWHPTNPSLKVYLEANQIGYFNVYNNERTVLRTFPEYSRIELGPWEGNLSYDGRMAVFYAQRRRGGHDVFSYDMVDNIKYPIKDLGNAAIDWASISPGGRYVVIMYNDTDTRVFDLNMKYLTRFTVNHNHYDLGIDEEREEIAVGVSKKSRYDGLIIKHRLRDSKLTKMTTGGYAIHTSVRNRFLPGWSYSSFSPSRARYRDEIVAVKMDGSEKVRRLCHMHNIQIDYLSEAMPVPSQDGKRVIFSSNWGKTKGRPVSTYVVDVRVPCPHLDPPK